MGRVLRNQDQERYRRAGFLAGYGGAWKLISRRFSAGGAGGLRMVRWRPWKRIRGLASGEFRPGSGGVFFEVGSLEQSFGPHDVNDKDRVTLNSVEDSERSKHKVAVS